MKGDAFGLLVRLCIIVEGINLGWQSLNAMAQLSFDRRRVNGPEESFPPVFIDEPQPDSLLKDGKRVDGRALGDVRPICT